MKSIFLMFSVLLLVGTASAQGLTLSSDSAQGQLAMKHVFNGFGCSGENISPELNWENAPEGTKNALCNLISVETCSSVSMCFGSNIALPIMGEVTFLLNKRS